MKQLCFILLILLSILNSGCVDKTDFEAHLQEKQVVSRPPLPENLVKAMNSVAPFFKPMGKPSPDEWLASFKENGQTFEQYFNSNAALPISERKTIYIQPIGKFTNRQLKIIQFTAEYLREFFGLPAKLLAQKQFKEPLSLKNYRINKFTKNKQIRTGFILEDLLLPNFPPDAAALIAFTNEDLFPDKNFNYVFGQASAELKVGVWSLYRLDENGDFETFLKRTLKIAVHETGHMFSFAHCTKYECVMSGTNHLAETDKHPIDACPECMAKICWMSGYDPKKRYENLAEFCKNHNLNEDFKKFIEKAVAVNDR